jgi:hypothetical protein
MVSRRDRGPGGWLIVVVVLALVAAAATVGVVVLKGGSSSAGASVLLEPTGSIGTDPFTASVSIGPAAAFPSNVQAITVATRKSLSSNAKTHTLVATGTAPGLYGGSGNVHVCDAQQLVTFLQQNPAKGAAWAGVLGIQPKDIPTYVAGLTPVILTNDTLVTNHGYVNGHATTLQSVLESSTAVMIDTTGTPRVKCNCGNPLTSPDPNASAAHTTGTVWVGYSPTQVTVVQAGKPIRNITVINVNSGDTYTQPVGSGVGNVTNEFVAAESYIGPPIVDATTILASPDGRTWTKVSEIQGDYISGLGYGNGTWLAVAPFTPDAPTNVYTSTDTRTWKKSTPLPAYVSAIAYGGGHWTAVGSTSSGPGRPSDAVAYSSTDARAWTKVATVAPTGSSSASFNGVAFENGEWVAIELNSPVSETGVPVQSDTISFYTSSDGTQWAADGGSFGSRGGPVAIAGGAGQWATTTAAPQAGDPSIRVSTDARSWPVAPVSGFASEDSPQAIAYGNGRWVVGAQNGQPSGLTVSTFYTSSDAKAWSGGGHTDLGLNAVAFGTVQSAAPLNAPAPVGASCAESLQTFAATGSSTLTSPIPGVHVVAVKQSTVDPTWGYFDYSRVGGADTKEFMQCGPLGWQGAAFDIGGNCKVLNLPTLSVPPAAVMQDLGLTC